MHFCPHCGNDLRPYLGASKQTSPKPSGRKEEYDPIRVWREILEEGEKVMETPPSPESLALNAASCVSSGETIVHLLFRESVTPVGGVLHLIAKSEGQGGVHSPEHLESMGYIVRDGSVVTVDDVPVGRAYEALQYWGGEKQHKRWHLSEPVSVNPSRNGRPLFMDEGMVAFSATWKDGAKAEEALLDLLDLFISGPRNEGRIATPVAMRIIPVNKA